MFLGVCDWNVVRNTRMSSGMSVSWNVFRNVFMIGMSLGTPCDWNAFVIECFLRMCDWNVLLTGIYL